jgi:hypothetical protein
MDLGKTVDKAWADKSAEEILDAPVSALNGLSEGDAEKLKAAFNVRTVRDLATNKFFVTARAFLLLADRAH